MNFATLQAHKEDNSGNSRVHTTAKANDAEKQYGWSYFQTNFPTKWSSRSFEQEFIPEDLHRGDIKNLWQFPKS